MLRTGVRIRTWIQNHDEAFLHGCMWMQAKADSGTKNWMLSIFQLTYSGWFQLTWWFLIPKSGCYSQEKNGIPVITRQCPGLWGHSQQGLHCEKPCSVQNVRKCTEQISKKKKKISRLCINCLWLFWRGSTYLPQLGFNTFFFHQVWTSQLRWVVTWLAVVHALEMAPRNVFSCTKFMTCWDPRKPWMTATPRYAGTKNQLCPSW